jgi:protein gp37
MCKGGNFPCYAYKLANGRLKQRYLANTNWRYIDGGNGYYAEHHPNNDPFYPRFWPERFNELPKLRKSSGIFTCDMSDLFGIGIPNEWTHLTTEAIKRHPEHRFYLLTKQPQNLINFSPFPPNCWVGVTATNEAMFMDAIEGLDKITASIKYISFEPLLKAIVPSAYSLFKKNINWIILGAQTKPYKPPKIEWVQEIVQAADKTGIAVFIKNNFGAYARNIALYPNMKVGDNSWDNIRQEMPK